MNTPLEALINNLISKYEKQANDLEEECLKFQKLSDWNNADVFEGKSETFKDVANELKQIINLSKSNSLSL